METALTTLPSNGHSLTAPELTALGQLSAVSPEAALRRPLADLVDMALAAAGPASGHTRRNYQTAIGQFVTYLDATMGHALPDELAGQWRPLARASLDRRRTVWAFNGPAAVLRLVAPSTLDGFRAQLEAGNASANTATNRVYAVRTFLSVAYREGVLTDEQAQALDLKPYRQRQKRDQKPVGRRLTRQEVRKLRAAPNLVTLRGKRDLAILDAQLYLGLRCEETAGLQLEDFSQDQGRLWLTMTGKGQKTRKLKLPDALYKSLTDWLTAAGLGQLGAGSGPIFLGVNRGANLTSHQVNCATIARLVSEYAAAAGLAPATGKGRLSPHDLRRTCARNAYDNGASLLLVQALLGHSDPKTTAHYIGLDQDEAEGAADFVRY